MAKKSNQTIVLGGDFNLPGIDWDNGVVNPKAVNKSQCELLLSNIDTHTLVQIIEEPTWEEHILDLLITNNPCLIKSFHSVAGISNHSAVVTELDIDPPHNHTKPHPVRQSKNANWEAIRPKIRSWRTSFSVDENWLRLKSILNQCLDKFIPTKMTSPQKNLPWLSKSLLAYIRKNNLYIVKTCSIRIKLTFGQSIKNYVNGRSSGQRAIRFSRWSFLKNKLSESLEQQKWKPLWRYIKSKRQDGNVVSPLKKHVNQIADTY